MKHIASVLLMAMLLAISVSLSPAQAAGPAWCTPIAKHDFWFKERMTQRGAWVTLSPSQQRYYKKVQTKVDKYRRNALRKMYRDNSATARQLVRDINFLGTFNANLPMDERDAYIEADQRKRTTIYVSCGFESYL